MVKLNVTPPDSDEWDDWRARARAATDEMEQNGPPFQIKDSLYKEMRGELFAICHHKCAYCECEIGGGQKGDVEHYRPKKGVKDVAFVPEGPGGKRKAVDVRVRIQGSEGEEPHPGYWWLAYEWDNLLPSCSNCNRPSRTPDGLVGKGERFPMIKPPEPSTYTCCRGGPLDQEQPVFINPTKEDPAGHVEFDPTTGLLIGRTDRGQMCIDLLGLNRERLVELRRERFLAAVTTARALFVATDPHEIEQYREQLRGYKVGTKPFSIAGRKGLEVEMRRLQDRLTSLD